MYGAKKLCKCLQLACITRKGGGAPPGGCPCRGESGALSPGGALEGGGLSPPDSWPCEVCVHAPRVRTFSWSCGALSLISPTVLPPCGPLPFLPHRPLRPAGLPHRPRAPAAGPACGPNPLCAGPACRRRRCPPVIAALLRAGRRSCRAPRWSGTAERKGFFIGDSDNPSPPSRSRRLPGGRQRSGRAPCWSGTAEKWEIFWDNPSPSRDASLQRRVLRC